MTIPYISQLSIIISCDTANLLSKIMMREGRYLTNKIISSSTINYYGEPCIAPSCACAPWKRPIKWMLVECWQFCLQLSKRHLLCTLSLWYKYKDKVSYIATLFATSGFVPSAITVFTFSAIQRQSVLHCRCPN